MKNFKNSAAPQFRAGIIPALIILTWWFLPLSSMAQESACCDCEKVNWNIKVTLMDGFAPVQSIDYKTYNGEIKLTEKEQTEEEFPDRVQLKSFTFDEGGLVIRLDDQKVQRESGLGGTHSISETDMTLHISASLAENQIWYKEESKCSVSIKDVGLKDEDVDFNLINLKSESAHSSGDESYVYNKLEKSYKYKHSGSYDIIDKKAGSATWLLKPMMTIESDDADCNSARCYMPLRVTFLWGEPTVDDEDETSMVTPLRPQNDLIITPYGTGNTSGDVIHLKVTNPTPDPISFSIGPAVVPPTGDYQGYTIIDEVTASIAPGETSIHTVDGLCNDIHSKPVQQGVKAINIDEWISDTEISLPFPPGTSLPENSGFEVSKIYEEAEKIDGYPVSGTFPTYMGTSIPFEYSIDIREDVTEAAPFLLTSMERIDAVYDSLYEAGEIETPFSSDPTKEALTGKQQSYWMYTSLLAGEPYTVEDFEEKLIEQFEVNSGVDYDDAPEEVKDKLKEGTEDFWDTFTLIGEEAKVLLTVPSGPKTSAEKLKCLCDSIKLKYRVGYIYSENDSFTIWKYNEEVFKFNTNRKIKETIQVPAFKFIDKKGTPVKDKDILTMDLAFPSALLHCSCNDEEIAKKEKDDCNEIFGARKGGEMKWDDSGSGYREPLVYSEEGKLSIEVKQSETFKTFKPSDADRDTKEAINNEKEKRNKELNDKLDSLQNALKVARQNRDRATVDAVTAELKKLKKEAKKDFDDWKKKQRAALKKRKKAIQNLRKKYPAGWYKKDEFPEDGFYGFPIYRVKDAKNFSMKINITGYCKGKNCGGDFGGAKCQLELTLNFLK